MQTSLNVGEVSVGVIVGISVEVNVGERVENPQQDAGWLQTSLNVGEVSVGVIVGISVEVNVGERVANPQ